MAQQQNQSRKDRRDRTVAVCCVALVAVMVGAAFASVHLYRLFCEATGFAGTPQRALSPSEASIDKTITVRFDANVTPRLTSKLAKTPWPSTARPTFRIMP